MVLGIVAVALLGQGGQSATAPERLDERSFTSVRAHASPSPQDLAFQRIDWKTSVFEGLLEAQKRDKPLLMWMYFGDPRGHC
jgi:hypothetical protein